MELSIKFNVEEKKIKEIMKILTDGENTYLVDEEKKTVCGIVRRPTFTFDKIGMNLVGTVTENCLAVSNDWLKKNGVDTGWKFETTWFYPLNNLEILSK